MQANKQQLFQGSVVFSFFVWGEFPYMVGFIMALQQQKKQKYPGRRIDTIKSGKFEFNELIHGVKSFHRAK